MDDNEENRVLVVRSLKKEGFDLHEAKDGYEALAKAREIKPDLVILDIMMPGMTGYEVCEFLRKTEQNKHTPILFLSARTGAVSRYSAQMAGGDAFMEKPFSPKEIREKVKLMFA